jgi:hypothetical protein
MTSRSDCEPLPKPTLSPFALALARPGTVLRVGFFHCRRVVCACSAGTVGSFSNKPLSQNKERCTLPDKHTHIYAECARPT